MTMDGQPFNRLPSIAFYGPGKEVAKQEHHHRTDVKEVRWMRFIFP